MAGTFTVTGLSASEPVGQRQFGPLTIVGTQVIGVTLEMPLAMGDNTVAVPTASVAVLIVAPINGAAALTLRTSANQADAGLPINGVGLPTVFAFQTTPTTLTINSTASQPSPITLAFI